MSGIYPLPDNPGAPFYRYDMFVRRVDGSSYLAATVNAQSTTKAHELYKPDYGFGVVAVRRNLIEGNS